MTITAIVLVVAAFASSLLLTHLSRQYAVRRSILDVPGARSSHQVPTPRGGGVSIVVTVLGAVSWLFLSGGMTVDLAVALGAGGAAVAAIGWADDHRPLGIGIRMLVHLGAAAVVIAALGVPSNVNWLFGDDNFGRWMLGLVSLVAIVWLINLYNFLDGTDGYAATEALCVAGAAAVIFAQGGEHAAALLCLVIAAASAGFLVWNWAPARVFMGDVGSYFLGMCFGVLALYGHVRGVAPAWVWLMLLGAFFWDATLTLLRRALTGERWLDPHRTHAYQRLHQMGWSHRSLALALLVLNVGVLWPMACVAVIWDNFRGLAFGASAMLLIGLWLLVEYRYVRKRLL